MGYKDYTKRDDKFFVNLNRDGQPKLPAGHYLLKYIPDADQLIFESIKFNHDELLEIPSKEFGDITNQIDTFLTPDTRELFDKYGFLYKRSILMHGVPGTGKTCLVNRIANKVVDEGGIILFNPDPRLLQKTYKVLADIQPESNLVVVFEELDKMVIGYEHQLLNLLDGEIQRDNVIYLATTNFIDKVPPRIMRPGRFSSVVEIPFPDATCRKFYLDNKIGKVDTEAEILNIVKATDGFSIDELKETVLSYKCLGISLDEVVTRIKKTKELSGSGKDNKNNDDDEYYDEDSWDVKGGMLSGRQAKAIMTASSKG